MVPTAVMILFAIVLVIAIAAGHYFLRHFGHSCSQCGRRATFLRELDGKERKDILRYFEKYECRTPDESLVCVCRHCLLVFDDFSGVSRGFEPEHFGVCKMCGGMVVCMGMNIRTDRMGKVREANRHLQHTGIECLVCRRNPMGWVDCLRCDTPVQLYACNRCYTAYAWRAVAWSPYAFLGPITEREDLDMLKKPTDGPMGWV